MRWPSISRMWREPVTVRAAPSNVTLRGMAPSMPHGKMVHVLKADVALIGGTGIGERLAELGGVPVHVPTPFGLLRGRLAESNGKRVFIVRRHSAGHKVPPHKVNYLAIGDGLRRIGVSHCLSSAAVGSLRDDWPVGTMASCTDFIDVSGRSLTLYSRDVRHTDFSSPFAASALIADVNSPCVYACVNGPKYETPKEVAMLRSLGGDVVGMTVASEAVVLREAGIAYGCLAIVTNMGCGIGTSPLSHGEVGDVMKTHGKRAVDILLQAVSSI